MLMKLLVDGASHHQWSTMVKNELLEPVALAEARLAVRKQVSAGDEESLSRSHATSQATNSQPDVSQASSLPCIFYFTCSV